MYFYSDDDEDDDDDSVQAENKTSALHSQPSK